MDDATRKFMHTLALTSTEEEAFCAGHTAALHGANTDNSHFRHFRTPLLMKAWERGKKRGDAERESLQGGSPK